MKKRVFVIIDGYNFYHSINDQIKYNKLYRFKNYKWTDFRTLSECFIRKDESVEKIIYCTALYPKKDSKQSKKEKHKIFISALEAKNVETVYGKFKNKTVRCKKCYKDFKTKEEKQTDINIAVRLISSAYEDLWDEVFIISGDTDLIPCVKMIKKQFPKKNIKFIFPINRVSNELKKLLGDKNCMKIKEPHLKASVLPRSIGDISCPDDWIHQH